MRSLNAHEWVLCIGDQNFTTIALTQAMSPIRWRDVFIARQSIFSIDIFGCFVKCYLDRPDTESKFIQGTVNSTSNAISNIKLKIPHVVNQVEYVFGICIECFL